MDPTATATAHAARELPEHLLANFTRRARPQGYLLATPRSQDDCVILLRSGRLRVFVANDDKELTLAYLSPGELYSTHTPAYLRCETDCEVLSMPTREFARTLSHEPRMFSMVMPALGRILEGSLALIEDLAFRDVAGRLARFLLVLARQQRGAVEKGTQVALELSVSEIALMLGATRQTISALLSSMEREGVIDRPTRGQLRILRPERLRRLQQGMAPAS